MKVSIYPIEGSKFGAHTDRAEIDGCAWEKDGSFSIVTPGFKVTLTADEADQVSAAINS